MTALTIMNCSIKRGCYNIMPCTYLYLQDNFYNRFDGAVSITVVLKEFDNKVEGSSFSKTFFLFFSFAFANMQEFFEIYMFAEKACFDVLCTCMRLHSVKWRSLYGDTATMQELLLKTCTSSAWRKRSLEGNCHRIVYGTGLQHSQTLANLPLRKLWKRRRRHRTNSNNQSNHRHLRRKCYWMSLTRVL